MISPCYLMNSCPVALLQLPCGLDKGLFAAVSDVYERALHLCELYFPSTHSGE